MNTTIFTARSTALNILVELYPLGQPEDISAETVFTRVRNQYYEEVSAPDAYLTDSYEVTFGKNDLSCITKLAQGWNTELLSTFIRAQSDFMMLLATEGIKAFDTPASYALKCAAAAIDNSFYNFADCAILSLDMPYFTTVMTSELLDAINHEPERFALIDVNPK